MTRRATFTARPTSGVNRFRHDIGDESGSVAGGAVIIGGRLAPADVEAIAAGAPVALDPAALAAVAANRAVLEAEIAAGTPIYGVTTGFGALVDHHIGPELQRRVQVDLLRSHAAGVGEPLPRGVVRAAIAVRLNGLLRGHSGIRPLIAERIVQLLNSGLLPDVPRTGSLGASGDLAPSAHAFLPLIGEGTLRDASGAVVPAPWEPLVLEAKEALALINGTHFMSAIGALAAQRAERLLDVADRAAAASLDALRGAPAALDPRVHALRDLPGQARSARAIATAVRGSTRTGARLQDAYSLRCAPQVHGAAREAHAFFTRIVRADLDAVTDNPLVFDDEPRVVSAGQFHGQALALAFDTLRLALADLASISERRTFRLLAPSANGGLPPFLSPQAGPASGYMIVQYTAAALVSELRALAHPVSTDSIPTSDNQEDHVSMGMTGALLTLEALPRVEQVLAAEVLCACQALDADPGRPGRGTARLHAAVRERVPTLTDDRPPAEDLRAVREVLF